MKEILHNKENNLVITPRRKRKRKQKQKQKRN